MGNLLTYSGIVTKVRAMHAGLLTNAQYEEMAAFNTVKEIAGYLSGFPAYQEAFAEIDESHLHRGDIEKILFQSLYKDYSKIYQFASITQRKFLKLYLRRYEVDVINYCFRITFNHYSESFDLNYKKPFFDHYSQISIDKLVTSKSIQELVENLKGTEYYIPLKKLQESGASTLFDYDLALDLYYFSSIWREKRKILSKKELEIFTRDSGSKIDLLNLQWIYRAKKYYNMQPAEIYALLIPIHYKIKKDVLRDLVETASLDEFLNLSDQTYYAMKYKHEEQQFTIERIYSDCLNRLYLTDRRRNPYSIATINTYLFQKEEEIQMITTIIECIRYGMPPRETIRYTGGELQP